MLSKWRQTEREREGGNAFLFKLLKLPAKLFVKPHGYENSLNKRRESCTAEETVSLTEKHLYRLLLWTFLFVMLLCADAGISWVHVCFMLVNIIRK